MSIKWRAYVVVYVYLNDRRIITPVERVIKPVKGREHGGRQRFALPNSHAVIIPAFPSTIKGEAQQV